MSAASTEVMKMAATHGGINLECMTSQVNHIVAALPNFVYSLDCAQNL